MTTQHDFEFNLKWWRLNITAENGYPKYHKMGLSGITVTGFNDQERDLIRRFARSLPDTRVGRIGYFHEDIIGPRLGIMPNSDGISIFEYQEREFGLFGSEENVSSIEDFLANLPQRKLETFVHGLTRGQIQSVCKGSNHRIIANSISRQGKVFAVSTDDNKAYFELFMRSKASAAVAA